MHTKTTQNNDDKKNHLKLNNLSSTKNFTININIKIVIKKMILKLLHDNH